MEFFKPLLSVAGNFESVTLKITPVGESITVMFLPGVNNKGVSEKLIPVTMTGTAAELDEEFLTHIKQAMSAVKGVTSNLADFERKLLETETEMKEEVKDNAVKPEKKAASSKPKKSAKPAKPAKVEKKPSATAGAKKEKKSEEVPASEPTVGALGI
jgi:PRTRC genetic system protein E